MSSIKFENAEFKIVEGDKRYLYIKVPKDLSNEDQEQYKQLRNEFVSNINNHKEYLKAHGVNSKWIVNKVMNGSSFKDLAFTIAYFVMQEEIELKQEEMNLDQIAEELNANDVVEDVQLNNEAVDAVEDIHYPTQAEIIKQIQDTDLDKDPIYTFLQKRLL